MSRMQEQVKPLHAWQSAWHSAVDVHISPPGPPLSAIHTRIHTRTHTHARTHTPHTHRLQSPACDLEEDSPVVVSTERWEAGG